MRSVLVLASFCLWAGCLAVLARKARAWSRGQAAAAAAGAAVLTAFSVILVTDCPWFGDFESAYYPAGAAALTLSVGYAQDCVSGFVNIPIVALLFAPFAAFAYPTAAALFTAAGLLSIAVAFGCLVRLCRLTPWEGAAAAMLFGLSGPLWYSVREGNTTHMVLPLLLGGIAQAQHRPRLAGGLLAAAAVIKLPLGILGIYYAWRREWSLIAAMSVAIAVIALASIGVFGAETHREWIVSCIVQPAGRPVPAFNVQSVDGVLARLWGGPFRSWTPMAMDGGFRATRTALLLVLGVTVAAVLVYAGRAETRRDRLVEVSAVIAFTLIIFPVSWTHYYLFLLLPLTLMMTRRIPPPGRPAARLAALAAGLAVLLPLRTPPTASEPWLHAALSLAPTSLPFFGAAVLLALLLSARVRGRSPRLSGQP